MTAAAAEALTTAEAGIIKGIASAAVAQEAEAEARRIELAEAAAASEQRRGELFRRRNKLSAARLEATAEAEMAAAALVKAFGSVQELAADELAVRGELGEPGLGLGAEGLARRLSAYLSGLLKTLPRAMDRRFGGVKLTNCAARDAKDWVAAERRATNSKTGGSDADNHAKN